MSRKTKTKKVTAPVTPKAPTTIPVEEALAMSAFSRRLGTVSGELAGFRAGLAAPRTAGEQRAKEQGAAIARILQEVFIETKGAVRKHGPMHSGHEGYAVIREELDELWDEVKADRGKQASARTEAIQVAAMAVRYALDIDPR